MIRIGFIILLSLSWLFLIKEMVVTLQDNGLSVVAEDEAKKGRAFSQSRPRPVTMYPAVPGVLPDMGKGYLFNEERSLDGGRPFGQDHDTVIVNIEDVTYEGSLIVGEDRIAILSYPERGQRTIRTSRIARRKVTTKETGHIRVRVGETISGYKVVEILPEKIIFSKGTERLEKVLFDSSKQRVVSDRPTPARPSPLMKTPATPSTPRQNPTTPPTNPGDRTNLIRRVPPPSPPSQVNQSGDNMINPFETGR